MSDKEIVLSIQPHHLWNILNGDKTLELRKSVPKGFEGWINLYCTLSKNGKGLYFDYLEKKFFLFEKGVNNGLINNGKIVARFWFDEYSTLEIGDDGCIWF